ncbi:hypothetical protein V8F33_004007 [Rhypophila sp. PSN 637]
MATTCPSTSEDWIRYLHDETGIWEPQRDLARNPVEEQETRLCVAWSRKLSRNRTTRRRRKGGFPGPPPRGKEASHMAKQKEQDLYGLGKTDGSHIKPLCFPLLIFPGGQWCVSLHTQDTRPVPIFSKSIMWSFRIAIFQKDTCSSSPTPLHMSSTIFPGGRPVREEPDAAVSTAEGELRLNSGKSQGKDMMDDTYDTNWDGVLYRMVL